jgi:hypothetical protein
MVVCLFEQNSDIRKMCRVVFHFKKGHLERNMIRSDHQLIGFEIYLSLRDFRLGDLFGDKTPVKSRMGNFGFG